MLAGFSVLSFCIFGRIDRRRPIFLLPVLYGSFCRCVNSAQRHAGFIQLETVTTVIDTNVSPCVVFS